jgi:hypothetical protein
MVGAIWLATKLFGVGPLAAMGIIMGSILMLATGFALLGAMQEPSWLPIPATGTGLPQTLISRGPLGPCRQQTTLLRYMMM